MGCTQSTDGDNSPPDMKGAKGVGHSERLGSRLKQDMKKKREELAKLNEEDLPKLDENQRLTPEEVQKRITKSQGVKETVIGDEDGNLFRIRYAFLTQRGYYPDDATKKNQDNFAIKHNFAGQTGDSYLAVFDGHGPFGYECAQFAKTQLPQSMEKFIRQSRVSSHKVNMKLEEGGSIPKGSFHPMFWPKLGEVEYGLICGSALEDCNDKLHFDKKMDDTVSGTTVISASFHNNNLIICNVGDSRALLGHRVSSHTIDKDTTNDPVVALSDQEEEEEEKEEITDAETALEKKPKPQHVQLPPLKEGTLLAVPLSHDQTPYRQDERDRVKQCGARVLTIDQMEGLEPIHEDYEQYKPDSGDCGSNSSIKNFDQVGDPPRVWCQEGDFPGTAFTRSIGDTVAEQIGVSCEPEIVTRKISKMDEVLVLASDGVFEFMTDQEVIDVCGECEGNPLVACENVAKKSYERWTEYEFRTDDITVIVAFIECDREMTEEDGKMIRSLLRSQGKPPDGSC